MNIEEMNEKAMEIIVHAGNGRNFLNQALDCLYNYDETNYKKFMEEAKLEMKLSHAAQTEVLNSTISDPDVKPSILFTHAQDTLMTVMSEINISKHLEKIMKRIADISNEKR